MRWRAGSGHYRYVLPGLFRSFAPGMLALLVCGQANAGDAGPAQQSAAEAIHRAGEGYLRLGKLVEAERAFRQALVIREAGLGQEHPSVAVELRSLAEVAERRGDAADAVSLCAEAARLVRYTVP